MTTPQGPRGYLEELISKNARESIKGLKFIATEFGEPINLPPESKDKFYIVSAVLKSACPERNDLIVPADFVRDDKGNITGCRAFSL